VAEKALIMDEISIRRAIYRMAHEIIERNKGARDLIFVGIKTRGFPLAKRLCRIVSELEDCIVPVYPLDVTPYRDDLRNYQSSQKSSYYEVPDTTANKVVLVDDVLYHGRTIRAALDALLGKGRPNVVQLAVLVDRGHRQLPIRADFVGKNIPTSEDDEVVVHLKEIDGCDEVLVQHIKSKQKLQST